MKPKDFLMIKIEGMIRTSHHSIKFGEIIKQNIDSNKIISSSRKTIKAFPTVIVWPKTDKVAIKIKKNLNRPTRCL